MTARTIAAGLTLGLSVSLLAQQRPTFRSEANYVEVTAVVTDSEGRFVPGLSASDFELREARRPQTVSVFSEVHLPTTPGGPPASNAPIAVRSPGVPSREEPSGRMYLLVLASATNIEDALACPVLGAARRFVNEYLLPGDVAAVWEGSSGRVAFTADRPLLLSKITARNAVAPEANLEGSAVGLHSAVDALGGIQGRSKALVFFSCGWVPGFVNENSRPMVPGDEYIYRQRLRNYEGFNLSGRADVHVYPVDTRGLLTGALTAETSGSPRPRTVLDRYALLLDSTNALQQVADATGGLAFYNDNDYRAAFGRIVEDNSRYYVLGYDSPIRKLDGTFVRVDVRLKPPGLTVRARQGYFAR